MLFRQLFDEESYTYTYLLGSDSQQVIIIDPVREQLPLYLQLLAELGLQLRYSIDTHVHADHITASGLLRQETQCGILMGEQSQAEGVTETVQDGDEISIDELVLKALYTPGHTDDSYCFLMADRVFTGDTLLIRSTGRTDFQNGSAEQAYHSLFDILLKLPDDMRVYPAHDYQGMTMSTIGEEKRYNPRLQISDLAAYVELMEHLNLDYPKKIEQAVPANLHCGI